MRSVFIISAENKGLYTVEKVMYHLQIILLKILSYQEDDLYILGRAKAQVLSPVELLLGLVTNLRNDC